MEKSKTKKRLVELWQDVFNAYSQQSLSVLSATNEINMTSQQTSFKHKQRFQKKNGYLLKTIAQKNLLLNFRELNVLLLFSEEYSVEQISCTLQISPHTVRFYLANLRKKLHTANQKELIRMIRELELVYIRST